MIQEIILASGEVYPIEEMKNWQDLGWKLTKPWARRLRKKYPNSNTGFMTGKAHNRIVLVLEENSIIANLTTKLTPLPDTYTVKAPDGSLHLHYQFPRSLKRLGSRMGIIADWDYAVAPGSTVEDGIYELTNDVKLATLPPSWVENLKPGKIQKATKDPEISLEVLESALIRLSPKGEYYSFKGNDLHDRVGAAIKATVGNAGFPMFRNWLGDNTTWEVLPKENDDFAIGHILDYAIKTGWQFPKSNKLIPGISPHWPSEGLIQPKNISVEIKEVVEKFFFKGINTGIRASAGSGKSMELIFWLAAIEGKSKVAVYLPTHNLANEFRDKILVINPNANVHVMNGRGVRQANGQRYCAKHKLANDVAKYGYNVFRSLCKNNYYNQRSQQQIYTECVHYRSCPYIKQKEKVKEANVILYMHAHLTLPQSKVDKCDVKFQIIDESFWSNTVKHTSTGLELIRNYLPHMHNIRAHHIIKLTGESVEKWAQRTGQTSTNMNKLEKDQVADAAADWFGKFKKFKSIICSHTGTLLLDLRNAGLSSKELKILQAGLPRSGSWNFQPNMSDKKNSTKLKKVAKEANKFPRLWRLLQCLIDEINLPRDTPQTVYYHQYKDKPGIRSCFRQKLDHLNPKAPTLLIDANLSKAISKVFFPDIKVSEFRTDRNAKVVQVYDHALSSSWVRKGNENVKLIQDALDQVAIDNSVTIGTSTICGGTKKCPKAKIKVRGSINHFGGIRGLNSYESKDMAIILGRQEKLPADIEVIARALYGLKQTLCLPGKFDYVPRGYRTRDGKKLGACVAKHPDPLVQDLLEQWREGESLQAIDRIRLIHNKKPKIVYIVSSVPLDLTVDRLVRLEDLANYKTMDEEFAKSVGKALVLTPQSLMKRMPNVFGNSKKAINFLNGGKTESNPVNFNNIYLEKLEQVNLYLNNTHVGLFKLQFSRNVVYCLGWNLEEATLEFKKTYPQVTGPVVEVVMP